MDFTGLSPYLLILTLSLLSSPPQTLGTCGTCSPSVGSVPLRPITVPPVIEKPPVTVPPITVTPIKLPITLPPVVENPPITIPVITPPAIKTPPCTPPKPKPKPKPCPPTPAAPTSCPIDTIKLGACLDVLGAVVHVGDPAVQCCPLIAGITSVQAVACLCTTIKVKALGINVFLPIALQLLLTCGKTPPPGYKCV